MTFKIANIWAALTRGRPATGGDPRRVSPGAVLLIPLESGGFGACRVIRKGDPKKVPPSDWMGVIENGVLVMATAWIADAAPNLKSESQVLKTPLKFTFGNWNGESQISWIKDEPPSAFKLIGILPPTRDEAKMTSENSVAWNWFSDLINRQAEFEGKSTYPKARSMDADGLADLLMTPPRPTA